MRKATQSFLLALLAAAGLSGAWILRVRSADPGDTHTSIEDQTSAPARIEAVDLVPPETWTAKNYENGVARERHEMASRTQSGIDVGTALWVEGRMILPDGTPPGDQLEVVVEGLEPAAKGDHRSLVDADGSFRVSLPSRTVRGTLGLRSSFLYLERDVRIDTSTLPKDLVLRPRLGGCVRGRLLLPPDSSAARKSLAGSRVRIQDSEASEFSALSAALEFEFHGLPPGDSYVVSLRSQGDWCITKLENVRVIAGGVTRADLDVFRGVRIVGRVVDERASPIAKARVEVWRPRPGAGESSGAGALEVDRAVRITRSDSDGRFMLTGVHPGELWLVAYDSRSTPAHVQLGTVGRGATLEDVLLVIGTDIAISGIVRWPDATLATKCTLIYEYKGGLPIEGPESKRYGSLVLEQGRFDIRVAGLGPWDLTARAVRSEDRAGSSPVTTKTWVAHVKSLMASTTEVVLTLAPSVSIRGRVLDEAGKPLPVRPMLWAYPTSSTDSRLLYTIAPPDDLCDPDGNFAFDGLHEGSWRIRALAPGYVEGSPTIVEIPGHGSLVDLTLNLAGTISGVVVDPGGQPVARAVVSVGRISEDPGPDTVQGTQGWVVNTDNDGRFSVREVVHGTLEIHASAQGWGSSGRFEVHLGRGQHVENLQLVLQPSEEPRW